MRIWKAVLFIASAFIFGCEPAKDKTQAKSIQSADQKIQAAKISLMQAKTVIKEFPRLDLFIRATRDYIILRQVELSDKPMDMKTSNELASARSRADDVLPALTVFTPMLVRVEKALLDLRGSLYQIMILDELSSSSRAALGQCRSKIRDLLDDLQLAKDVINTPESLYPHSTDYYNPDFEGVLRIIDSTLHTAITK